MRESNATTETRQRIIDYAIGQFWRYGYSGITIDEIAGELRISKATFYNFFKSKEDLVVRRPVSTTAGWDSTPWER